MIIIFEGPDNVGKGTQINLLRTYFGNINKITHIIKYSNILTENIYEYSKIQYNEMFKIMKKLNDNFYLIFDRSHIGENVYSPIYRNYNGEYIYDIEKKYIKSNFWNSIFLITLYDEPENLIKRDDGLSFSIKLEKKQKEIDLFINSTKQSNINKKLLLNCNKMSINIIHNKIIEFLKRNSNETWV